MKYHTIIVPLVAFVSLVLAETPSDQGEYSPKPQESPSQTMSFPPLASQSVQYSPDQNQYVPKAAPVKNRMRRARLHEARDEPESPESCGLLYVQASDGAYSGYVSAQRDPNGRHTVVSDAKDGLTATLVSHNIVPDNGQGYDVVGGTFGPSRDKEPRRSQFAGNSKNFAMLTGTSITPYGSRATHGRSSFNDAVTPRAHQRIESAVFQFGENKEIHPSWVDLDGSRIPAVWGVNAHRQIVFSANVGQYIAEFGGKSAQVFCKKPTVPA